MIEIITTHSRPYYIFLYSDGQAITLAGGFTNKREANKCRSRWRRRWRELPFGKKRDIFELIKQSLQE